jgi:imidazolonepropionase-like amidohydrolase
MFRLVTATTMTTDPTDLQHIVKPWQPNPQRTYIFTSANLIDPVTGTIAKNTTVKLSDGFVSSVRTSEEGVADKVDPEAVQVDMRGKYICPGLIDSHVHIAAVPGSLSLREMKEMSNHQSILRQPSVCKSMLARGFTTVRDCGGASLALKESLQEGIICGPRLFIAGHALSQTGGHGDRRQQHDPNECCAGHVNGIGRIVDGVDQCLKYAREELRQGSDFIKIMGGGGVASPTDQIQHLQFSDEEIRAIVTVANNAGTYVTSHAYTPQAIQQAVKQGVKGIEHGNLIDENTAEMMKQNGVFLTPTLVTYATMAAPQFSGFLPAISEKKNREVLDQGLRALELANKIGVDICFGTDLLGPLHYAQSKEFAIRGSIQTPAEILRSATTTPARMLRQDNFLGRIAPGFAADMLVLNANPLDDITIFDRPDQHLLATIKEGRVLSSRWSLLDAEASHLPKIE